MSSQPRSSPTSTPSGSPATRQALPIATPTAGKALAKRTGKSAVKQPSSSARKSVGGKTGPKKAEGDKPKRKKKRHETFNTHLFKVLKQIHPDVGISRKAMSVLNSFTMDIFQRLALVIPGELAKHSVSEARKAMIKYADSVGKTSQGKAGKRLKDLD